MKHKNIRTLDGHPLVAYAICAAIESSVFDGVICITDSHQYGTIAEGYGAEVPQLRPASTATDLSPDFQWIEWILNLLEDEGRPASSFAVLRPTNPFRSSAMIRQAYESFRSRSDCHSLRAVRRCREHPMKTWSLSEGFLVPYTNEVIDGIPAHSNQYAKLPEVFVQDASLEFCWSWVVRHFANSSGDRILPFFAPGYEGFDINSEEDWLLASVLVNQRLADLPTIQKRNGE